MPVRFPDFNQKNRCMRNRVLLTCLLISLASLVWSGLFIYRSSYLGLDGHRYFGLADDAMISMRYAWNFAHGQGLVWNAGQRIEGYSNLLMTLLMSAAALFLEQASRSSGGPALRRYHVAGCCLYHKANSR